MHLIYGGFYALMTVMMCVPIFATSARALTCRLSNRPTGVGSNLNGD